MTPLAHESHVLGVYAVARGSHRVSKASGMPIQKPLSGDSGGPIDAKTVETPTLE